MTVTLVGMLEKGYPDSIEHMIWRQLKGAYGCELRLVDHNYDTMESALKGLTNRVFLVRLHQGSTELANFTPPDPVTYIFGRPGENLECFFNPDSDSAVSIKTPNYVDLMAVTVAGIVLREHRQ